MFRAIHNEYCNEERVRTPVLVQKRLITPSLFSHPVYTNLLTSRFSVSCFCLGSGHSLYLFSLVANPLLLLWCILAVYSQSSISSTEDRLEPFGPISCLPSLGSFLVFFRLSLSTTVVSSSYILLFVFLVSCFLFLLVSCFIFPF